MEVETNWSLSETSNNQSRAPFFRSSTVETYLAWVEYGRARFFSAEKVKTYTKLAETVKAYRLLAETVEKHQILVETAETRFRSVLINSICCGFSQFSVLSFFLFTAEDDDDENEETIECYEDTEYNLQSAPLEDNQTSTLKHPSKTASVSVTSGSVASVPKRSIFAAPKWNPKDPGSSLTLNNVFIYCSLEIRTECSDSPTPVICSNKNVEVVFKKLFSKNII